MSVPILETKGLHTGYFHRGKHRTVSQDLDLSLDKGSVTALIGPNGSGKSTLLRTIAGLQPVLSGDIFVESRPVHSYTARQLARLISVVLTGRYVPGHMRAEQVVRMGRYPHTDLLGRFSEADGQAVERALSAAGADGLRDRPVDELSDGELQKIMIARALAQEPRIMMLDEPTAFLDVTRKLELMHLLKDISRKNRTAVLVSSHDLELVMRITDKVWLIDESGYVEEGRPSDSEFLRQTRKVFEIPEAYQFENGI